MNKIRLVVFLLISLCVMSASAFTSEEQRVDYLLNIISKEGDYQQKHVVLKRLQWSGIFDTRLYDSIEKYLVAHASDKLADTSKNEQDVLAYMLRALGYSGNDKYRKTIGIYQQGALSNRLSGHAKKARRDLPQFASWSRLITNSSVDVEGKSIEVATYMKMLSTEDTGLQRLGARGAFHEKQTDPDLLAIVATRLKATYLNKTIDRQEQDTVAWFCKVIGQSKKPEYSELLSDAEKNSPHAKIRKYARKYAI